MFWRGEGFYILLMDTTSELHRPGELKRYETASRAAYSL